MSAPPTGTADAIDAILGETTAGRVAELRRQKPELAAQLQDYYRAVFAPEVASAAAFPLADRAVVAVRVASHTGSAGVADWYARLAEGAGVPAETIALARDVASAWPDDDRLGAAIRHADLLTTQPAATGPADLAALKAAGFSPAGILSLSQTVAFVAYQLRLIAGLRALGEAA